MNQVLQGRVALITGGGRGIGRATAIRLARMGAAVALSGRTAEPLDATAAEIEAGGGRGLAIAGDVSVEADAERMVAQAADRFGRLDIVVNNAGLLHWSLLEETTLADFRRMLDVNLTGTFLVCRAAVARLTAPGGVIVNVSTGGAIRAVPGYVAYGSAKAAVLYLTRVLSLECAPKGIRVNSVSPGAIDTPMHATVMTEEQLAELPARVAEWTPLRRLGTPEEVASAIAYLVSPEAEYVSGINLSVDGGSTAA